MNYSPRPLCGSAKNPANPGRAAPAAAGTEVALTATIVTRPYVYADRPQRVYWEITRACDLACRHCRAEAAPDCHPEQLTTAEGVALLERMAAFGAPLPHVVLTGGDPLKRADLFELIAVARRLGLGVSVAPSATPLLTEDALRRLKDAGVEAISLSLDAASARQHDLLRMVPGTCNRTIEAARIAREIGLPFQVNTLVCEETVDDLPALYAQVIAMGAARWSLFFLVTVGRGQVLRQVSPQRAERVLHWVESLSALPGAGDLIVTTTEAPQYRRVAIERRHRPPRHGGGIRDGNGILFVSHTGEICPSGFLELSAGNVRRDDIVAVYRDAPLFKALRDPDQFTGRCGVCEYRWICGGSRARAWLASCDPLAEDPLCVHQPAGVHAAGA